MASVNGSVFLVMNIKRNANITIRSISKTVVMDLGPVWAKICPISHGSNMLPAPEPTRNHPVIVPVICIRSPASMISVGKMDAMDMPSPKVPIRSMRLESFHIRMRMVLTAHPTISMKRMVCERRRVETHMPINLPNVNDPQKREVR